MNNGRVNQGDNEDSVAAQDAAAAGHILATYTRLDAAFGREVAARHKAEGLLADCRADRDALRSAVSDREADLIEAQAAVIQRLRDGWEPDLVYGQWRKPDPDEQRPWASVFTQMSDAQRAVLDGAS